MRKNYGALLLLIAAITLSGCDSSASNFTTNIENESALKLNSEPREVAAYTYNDYAEEDLGDYAMEEEVASSDGYAQKNVASDESTDFNDASGKEVKEATSDEKLVYTCDLRMQTLTYDETLANVRKAIEAAGGIIQDENETNNNSYWYENDDINRPDQMRIYLTVRIPSKNYKSFLSSIDKEGKILSKSSNVENITRRYHDTEAIIRNLETQESRLLQMMEQAADVEEMITVETRLTEVQTQLDQNRTYLASMDTDVAYSTVTMTIEEVFQYKADPPKKETFSDRLQNALSGSWNNFLKFLETVLFAVIYIAPLAMVVLAVLLVVFLISKAWRKAHPRKIQKIDRSVFTQQPKPAAGKAIQEKPIIEEKEKSKTKE